MGRVQWGCRGQQGAAICPTLSRSQRGRELSVPAVPDGSRYRTLVLRIQRQRCSPSPRSGCRRRDGAITNDDF